MTSEEKGKSEFKGIVPEGFFDIWEIAIDDDTVSHDATFEDGCGQYTYYRDFSVTFYRLDDLDKFVSYQCILDAWGSSEYHYTPATYWEPEDWNETEVEFADWNSDPTETSVYDSYGLDEATIQELQGYVETFLQREQRFVEKYPGDYFQAD